MKRITRPFTDWHRSIEARLMSRLSAEERADALQLDVYFRENRAYLTLCVGVLIASLALVLKLSIAKAGWIESFVIATIFVVSVGFGLLSAWAGARRKGPRAFRGAKAFFAIILIAIAGGLVGGLIGSVVKRGWEGALQHMTTLSGGVLAGVALFGAIYALAAIFLHRIRHKQIEMENELLAKQAHAERIARLLTDSRLKLMQAQVEPHFLFNTLASVQDLAEDKAPEAAQLTHELIAFLRGGLVSLREDVTSLSSEFAMISAYLNIMRVRMGARLTFTLELPDHLRDARIPPAMLISLVENAIKHGIEPSRTGGALHVAAEAASGTLLLSVRDTGVGMRPGQGDANGGFGLANIRERLRALFTDTATLTVQDNPAGGCTAELRIPLTFAQTTEAA